MVDGPVEKPPRGPDRLTACLALGGVVGPILFVVSFTVAGWLRPGHSPISEVVSELGMGRVAKQPV